MASSNFLMLLLMLLASSSIGATTRQRVKRAREIASVPEETHNKRQCRQRSTFLQDENMEPVMAGRRTTRSMTTGVRKVYSELADSKEEEEVKIAVEAVDYKPKAPEHSPALEQRKGKRFVNFSLEDQKNEIRNYFYNCYRDPINDEYLGETITKTIHDPFDKLPPVPNSDVYFCHHHPESMDGHRFPNDPWRNRRWSPINLVRLMNSNFDEPKPMPSDWLTPELMEEWINYTAASKSK